VAIKIKPPRNLPPDMLGVFERMAKLVAGPKADSLYNALPQSRRAKLISVDVARLLAPEFRTWSGRIRHTAATGGPAGAYAHDRLIRELNNRGKRRTLLLTAGGAGSGKTSQLMQQASSADLVFDNQLRDWLRACEILRAAIANGWQTQVIYVHRPFPDVVRAVIERSQRTGRWNLLAELPAAHSEAQQTIVRLWRAFRDSVTVLAIYNAASGNAERPVGSQIKAQDLAPNGRYHYADVQALASQIEPVLKAATKDGAVCKEIARLIGRRPKNGQGHKGN